MAILAQKLVYVYILANGNVSTNRNPGYYFLLQETHSVNIKASNCNCCFVVVKIAHWGYIRSRSVFCIAIRFIIGQILLFHFAFI